MENDALAELYREHARDLARFLLRWGVPTDELDDLMQDCWVVLCEKHDKIVPGRERGFLYGVARNVACAYRRRSSEWRSVNGIPFSEAAVAACTAARCQAHLEGQTCLDLIAAIEHLSPSFRQIVEKMGFEGSSYAEVAGLLGVSEAAVRQRAYRARRQIKAWLQLEAPRAPPPSAEAASELGR
jgi:RNA polymerase sigma-70 factor (ECF subfamily)